MTPSKRIGQIIGMLVLVQLVTGLIVPYVLLSPLTAGSGAFLDTAAGMSVLVRLNVLLLFVGGAVSVGISVAAWPVVRERGYRLGLWLLALAVVNFTLQIIENVHWLSMLSVSQAYVEAGAADAGLFQSLGIVVYSAFRWAHYSHILVVVGWIFTLYWLLFRCAMVPRALAAVGMVACVLQYVGITLPAFAGYSMPPSAFFGMPLGLANLALAVWLMAKGFKEPNAIRDAETQTAEVSES
jgi:hypothetical protein